MNVAIIQPVPAPSARLAGAAPRQARPARAAPAGGWRLPYRFDVAALAAALRARGHNVSLTILDTCDESALAAQGRPEIAFIYIEGLAADLAVRLAGTLAAVHGAPLVPFGPHASYRPDDCLSLPGAEAVLVGPADLAAAEYLARRTGLDHARTPGFWVKCAGGVMRNPPPHPPASLARSPPPARDLYPTDLLVDAAGFAEVHAARGGEADGAAPPAAGGARVPPPAPAEPCWPPTAA
ncbi:MAG: hypothetical protein FJ288_17620, partial [Planctomycetes bacterium]|nr:hypothetical protein [Planctomycetota bacterium]